MRPYIHTQVGKTLIYPLVGMALAGFAIALLWPNARISVLPGILLLITAVLFWKLTVTVDDKTLRLAFGPGLVSKNVPISAVERCEPMRVRFWHGWGIHLTTNGWLYNVSGPDAVIVTLRDGRRFCVGTDEPQELLAAIRRFASAR